MSETYHVPWYNRFARILILPLFRLIFRTLSHVEDRGFENIPAGQPYLLVFNHVSLYDAPLVASHWPENLEILGASDVWNRPGVSILAKAYGGIPIHRGEVDRTAMNKMLAVLENGIPLMVAPEGGRSHKPGLRIGKPGIAFVYEKMKIPFVPVGVVGTTDDYLSNIIHLRHPHAGINIGKSFYLPEDLGQELHRSQKYQIQVDYVMRKIAELLPPEYRGVYA
jgi:1-acyl-sn-glycerol-3-phosphate acyltransferase